MESLNSVHASEQNKENLIIHSAAMQQVFRIAKRLSAFNSNVLITGESGVGKEEVTRYIHRNSLRAKRPFVAVNCGAIPENLLESELFGYEGGAFTGALKTGKAGLFEAANGGTLMLDEVGEMPLSGTWICRCSPSCCGCWSRERLSALEATRRFRWMYGLFRLRTRIWRRWQSRENSEKISTIG